MGCSIVGGCCGVFPEHIQSIADYNRLINFALDDKAEEKYNAIIKSQKDICVDDLPTLDLDTPGVKERIAEDSKKLEKFRNEMKGQHEAKQREFEMILEEQRTAEMMHEDMLSHVLLNRV